MRRYNGKILFVFFLMAGLLAFTFAAIAEEQLYTNAADAAAYLRSQLVGRNETVEILFETASPVETAQEILDLATKESTDPREGDYLRHSALRRSEISVSFTQTAENICRLRYNLAYLTTAQQEAQFDAALQSVMQDLNLNGRSEYEKACEIYRYICANVRYDYANKGNEEYGLQHSAYAALIHKTAVCDGYAALYYRMAEAAGLDCRIMVGMAGGESHAWNIVKIDGSHYFLDATWDEGAYEYNWFLKGYNDFADHEGADRSSVSINGDAYAMSDASYDANSSMEYAQGDFKYRVKDCRAIITGYTGEETHLVVPGTIGGYRVEGVAQHAIAHRISEGSFNDYSKLKSVEFSENIEYLANECIFSCSALETIKLPSTLKGLMISYTDGSVQVQDFNSYYSLFNAFTCPNVKEFIVAEGNNAIFSMSGIVYKKAGNNILYFPPNLAAEVLELPEGTTSIPNLAGNKNIRRIILPDSVTVIGASQFEGMEKLEQVNIPETCIRIEDRAFSGTAVRSLHIPAACENIFQEAFYNVSLTSLSVDADNPNYYVSDGYLFARYGFDMRYISGLGNTRYWVDGLSLLYCFGKDKQERITIPSGVTDIAGAFAPNSSIRELTIPASVKKIWDCPFQQWECLHIANVPASVTDLEDRIFMFPPKTMVFFGEKGSAIETYANKYQTDPGFYGKYHFREAGSGYVVSGSAGGDAVWTMDFSQNTLRFSGSGAIEESRAPEWYGFRSAIREIHFGKDISSIPRIEGMYWNEAVYFEGDAPAISWLAFNGMKNIKAWYPEGNATWTPGKMQNYLAESVAWAPYDPYAIECTRLPAGLKEIQAEAFDSAPLKGVVICPESMLSIGSNAFRNSRIEGIYLPDSVQSIAPDSFSGISPVIYCNPGSVAADFAGDTGLATAFPDVLPLD